MEPKKNPSVVGEDSDYLCMTSPQTATSQPTPEDSNNSSQFVFNFSAKSHKGQEKEAVDSVEMCPMLEDSAQAFSNPNYMSNLGMKMSDFEDGSLKPQNVTGPSNGHYVNTPFASAIEANDEEHYVVPKNNSSVV